jgi:metal-responsive CopG/Arc/MetJ family transcriptional regulator
MTKSKIISLSIDLRLVDEIDRRRKTISRSSYVEFLLFEALGIENK